MEFDFDSGLGFDSDKENCSPCSTPKFMTRPQKRSMSVDLTNTIGALSMKYVIIYL